MRAFFQKVAKRPKDLAIFIAAAKVKYKKEKMSLSSVTDMKANTGFGLLAKQTLDHEFSDAVAGNRIDQAVDQIQDCKTELDMLGIQNIVADAWYSKERFIVSAH